jgi:hypothetical protein
MTNGELAPGGPSRTADQSERYIIGARKPIFWAVRSCSRSPFDGQLFLYLVHWKLADVERMLEK